MAVLLLVGCSGEPDEARILADGRIQHGEGGGPLSASSGKGLNSVFAPRRTPWHATFGLYLLCARDPDVEPVLEKVTVEFDLAPVASVIYLREAPRRERRLSRRLWDMVQSDSRQVPPEVRRMWRREGSFSSRVRGHRVVHSCESLRDRREPFTEMLVEMEVDRAGALARRTLVDYVADGEEYQLVIDWQMIACGTSPTLDRDDVGACPSSGAGVIPGTQ